MSGILDTQIRCPGCSAKFALREGLEDSSAAALADRAAALGPDWRAAQPYLSCFRTEQGKGVRLERLLLILDELADIWRRKVFTVQGKVYTVTPLVLREALGEMSSRADTMTGLKNHNYFKKILLGKMQKLNAVESKTERQQIERDKSGASRKDEDVQLMPETLAMLERSRQEREARLTDEERAVRKSPVGARPVSPASAKMTEAEREQAIERTRADLRVAGWTEEQIGQELKKRGYE